MSELLEGRRVLVVEDEMMIAMMIEDMLEDLGCSSVTVAATLDEALACIDAETFDLAMLDLNLDGQGTYPVADRLAACGVPFLFATAYSDHGLDEGYDNRPMLNKPFQHADLTQVVKRLLS